MSLADMDALFALKPLAAALVLPPAGLVIPLTAVLLWKGPLRGTRKALGLLLILLLWLTATQGLGRWIIEHVLHPPPGLNLEVWQHRLTEDPGLRSRTTVLVLGAGRRIQAQEYGPAHGALTDNGQTRLDYGLWLSRRLNTSLSYAGGVGWGQKGGDSEADVAEQIVRDEGAAPLRVKEGRSRDTRENAALSLPALKASGVHTVILVTHCWHMPRAMRHFSAMAAAEGIEVVPAPIDFPTRDGLTVLDWIPTPHGHRLASTVLHEVLGLLVKA